MSHYKTVWTPDGVAFEVNPDLASDLVLNKGWFNSQPVIEEPEIVGDDEAPTPPRKGRKSKLESPSEDEG